MLPVPVLSRLVRFFSLGIVTGRPHAEAQHVLERFQTLSFFPVVITMDDVPKGKAKPDPLGIEWLWIIFRALPVSLWEILWTISKLPSGRDCDPSEWLLLVGWEVVISKEIS